MSQFYQEFEAYLKGEPSTIHKQIKSDEKGSAIERINIYREAYQFRLIDILQGSFPTIYEILGTEDFTSMALNYIKKYPSTSFTVRHLGQHLSQFLQQESPYSAHTYLWQMADFEWAKASVFDAEDSPIITFADWGKVPSDTWLTVKFTFITALRRLVYDYETPEIYQAINKNQSLEEPVQLNKPVAWLMWRKDLNPHWFSMESDEDWFFIQARQGVSFGELCEGLSAWHSEEEIPARAAEIIRRWINEKMLANINTAINTAIK